MSTRRETAELIVKGSIYMVRYGDEGLPVHTCINREQLTSTIESALKARDERAAKIVESVDLTDWVQNGGRLRTVIATAVLDEDNQ